MKLQFISVQSVCLAHGPKENFDNFFPDPREALAIPMVLRHWSLSIIHIHSGGFFFLKKEHTKKETHKKCSKELKLCEVKRNKKTEEHST